MRLDLYHRSCSTASAVIGQHETIAPSYRIAKVCRRWPGRGLARLAPLMMLDMCGRYILHSPPHRIAELFAAQLTPSIAALQPRYNIAPTAPAPVVRMADVSQVVELMRWGLIPHGSREPNTKFATFNARSEDAADKTSYREPMRWRTR